MSICLSLKISVTTELIWFYSSGNIPTGPRVVLGYFKVWVGLTVTPPYPRPWKSIGEAISIYQGNTIKRELYINNIIKSEAFL